MNKCTAPGCDRKVIAKGFCPLHYVHYKKEFTMCSVEGCSNQVKSKGLCAKHYERLRVHGDVTVNNTPNYGRGYRIVNGYKVIRVNGIGKYEHTILAEKALGKPLPAKAVIHHMNGKSWDNYTPFNLVVCPDQAYHLLLHKRARELQKYGRCISTT